MLTTDVRRTRIERVLRAAVLAMGAVLAGFFVYVVIARAVHPIALEWMTGAILDHVERVRAGLPVYAPPKVEFIAFLYPPLYYWASAILAGQGAVVVACRAISIASTLASAALIALIARTLGSSRYFAVVGVLLFAGAYSYTGYFYDLERCDSLFVALLLAATWALLRWRSLASAGAAGALFALAMLTKQQAFVVMLGAAVGLALTRERRRLAALAASAALVAGPVVVWLQHSTGGWFSYYVLSVPARHGLEIRFLSLFLISDVAQAFALAGATVAAVWTSARALSRRGDASPRDVDDVVFGGTLAAAFIAAGTSRLHLGGFVNVLMPWSSMACIAFAVAASRLDAIADASRRGAVLVSAAALLQLMRFAYDPDEATPTLAHVRAANALDARVHALERTGEVFLHGTGHETSRPHFHAAALQDLLRAGAALPDDVVLAFRTQRFAAFVIDDFHELTLERLIRGAQLFPLVTSSYYVAERFDDRDPPPVVGWPAHPTWVLRPRARPLDGWSTPALLRRQAIEAALAEKRMRLARVGVIDAPESVEDEAARLDAAP
jgi:hypothetical protein